MRIALYVAAAIFLIVGVIAAIGWALPAGHVASRSATLKQSPDMVFAAVSDVAAYPKWWPDLSRVEMLEPVNGRVRFREHMNDGPIVMEIEEARPPSRFVTRIADPDQPFGGTWTFDIEPAGSATRLTITERGEVYNPIFRFLSRFVFGHTSTMESYLTAMERHLQ